MTHHPHNTRRLALRRGFTIIELLVVISIILIAVVAILPAFGRLIESNNYASAVNAVTATLGAARTNAVKNGRRAGVVFLWDAKEERMTLQIVEWLGDGFLTDKTPLCTAIGPDAYAEVFKPADLAAPIVLPKGMGVFGLSSAMETDDCGNEFLLVEDPVNMWRWYAGDVIPGPDSGPADDIYLWIFPRNDPRVFTDKDTTTNIGVDPWLTLLGVTTSPAIPQDKAIEAIRNTTSFFILFDPDGSITTSRALGGQFDAFLELPNDPVNPTLPASMPYDENFMFDPENFNGLPEDMRAANPEVVLRSADQLAIVDLNKLSDGVGMPRAWLIRPASSKAPLPPYLMDAGYFNDTRARAVSRWIDINGEIISFNRYSGNVIRRSSQ